MQLTHQISRPGTELGPNCGVGARCVGLKGIGSGGSVHDRSAPLRNFRSVSDDGGGGGDDDEDEYATVLVEAFSRAWPLAAAAPHRPSFLI